jgi:hypothetical protein
MFGLDEPDDGFGVEVNIGIYEHKMGRLGFLIKASHGQITGPVYERLVLGRVEHHLNSVGRAGSLETQHGLGIGLKTNTSVTRGAHE